MAVQGRYASTQVGRQGGRRDTNDLGELFCLPPDSAQGQVGNTYEGFLCFDNMEKNI